MSTLKEFAHKSGKTVIATIHQPSSKLFQLFDKLLLLTDGHVSKDLSITILNFCGNLTKRGDVEKIDREEHVDSELCSELDEEIEIKKDRYIDR